MRILSYSKLLFSALLLGSVMTPVIGMVSSSVVLASPQVSSTAVEATKLALKGQFAQAGPMAERSGDPAAVRLVEMLYLRDHWKEAGTARIVNFLNNSPNWPMSEALLKRAELALYANHESSQEVANFFSKRKPVTAQGRLALARAQLAAGNQAGARELVRQAWLDAEISADLEKNILDEFGNQLTADDQRQRVWQLVYAQSGSGAVRASKRLGGDYQKAASAAQMLLSGSSKGEAAYQSLPQAMREQLGMKFALALYYRKKSDYAKARAVLVTVPGNAAAMGDAEAWWTERRIIARRSVGPSNRSNAKAAYIIAKNNGFSSGPNAIEGEFLAGWIALRYLNTPQVAVQHFQRLGQVADSRTEKARASYWMGRAQAALGNKGEANKYYQDASQYSTVYYGQLAREQIGMGKVPENINSGQASAEATRRVDQDEVVRALKMVSDAGGTTSSMTIFLSSLSKRFNNVDEMNAVATVAYEAGGTTLAVRLAKVAGQRNLDIDSWSYPVKALPNWTQIGPPVEKSLVFGLSRQESEFDPRAGSKVGAQGLMQIMPGTAQMIAKRYGLPYSTDMLMDDPAYNVKLGAAHLGDLVSNFNGSYVLTLVAYNAGPRRSREWVAEYGDLRGGQVDAIDWVESIPFQETRQYVQKVLQNIHVYRSRLAPKTVQPMSADLTRGQPASIAVATSDSPAPAPAICKGKKKPSANGSCD